MGLGIPFGSARRSERQQFAPGDPIPHRFTVKKTEQHGEFVIAEVRYWDATTFEGRKLSVYRATAKALRSATGLDPHFRETGEFVPLARFAPTKEGWALARRMLGVGK